MEHGSEAGDSALNPRRAFLAWASGALFLLITLILAIPLVGFAFAPVFARQRRRWVKLGRTADVPLGVPTKLVYSYPAREGGLSTLVQGAVYVDTEDGRNFRILSNLCSHAHCAVQWSAETGVFQCPCHEGRFDRSGHVVSGPPPAPLVQFAHKIDAKGYLYAELGES